MRWVLSLLAASLVLAPSVRGEEPVPIGMITTLSTNAGYLGEDIRDGFALAMGDDGRLGGVAVTLTVEDDGRSPEKGRQIAERMVERDGIRILTGIVFSNIAVAVVPRVVRADAFFISANAGPSLLAGKACHENYFNVAWQNDSLHEASGKSIDRAGHARVYALAPNYAAGKDAVSGFKRGYGGTVVGETYSQLGQTDYAAEIAIIRDAAPDAVFFFLPGGMGINFIKQFDQAGLRDRIPLFGAAFSFDERLLQAVGDAALGAVNTSQWAHDLDVPANRAFVDGFIARYGRMPTLYASQGYDAARLIGSALAAVAGDLSDPTAFRAALRRADFESVRGAFDFAANQHPVQDLHARRVVKSDDGTVTNALIGPVFAGHADPYGDACRL